jgi:hypothetical protein
MRCVWCGVNGAVWEQMGVCAVSQEPKWVGVRLGVLGVGGDGQGDSDHQKRNGPMMGR